MLPEYQMADKKKLSVRTTGDKARLTLAVQRLEKRVHSLEEKIADKVSLQPYVARIATLVPVRLQMKKDIPVLLKPQGEEFVASFLDANVNASGETEAEALNNLKATLATVFEKLRSLPAKNLGPGPARQLAVLREFIETR